MRRRAFIGLLGGAAAWPLTMRAQDASRPVVGFLNLASAAQSAERVALFRKGLNDMGFVEGRNIAVEYRWADGRYEVLPQLAAELVKRQPAVFAATGAAAVRAVKAAAATTPIVFYIGDDPIAAGFVASLSRPGGNITGIYNWSQQVAPKRLQLLHELVPGAKIVGYLVNPDNAATVEQRSIDMRAAGEKLGLQVRELRARSEPEISAAFDSLKTMGAAGLLIAGDLFFAQQNERLATLAQQHALPAVSEYREFATAGGLASYGVGVSTDSYVHVGTYTGRILKGEKPVDLPVQQATSVRLVLNLKAAKALGVTVPLPLLGRADEVIE